MVKRGKVGVRICDFNFNSRVEEFEKSLELMKWHSVTVLFDNHVVDGIFLIPHISLMQINVYVTTVVCMCRKRFLLKWLSGIWYVVYLYIYICGIVSVVVCMHTAVDINIRLMFCSVLFWCRQENWRSRLHRSLGSLTKCAEYDTAVCMVERQKGRRLQISKEVAIYVKLLNDVAVTCYFDVAYIWRDVLIVRSQLLT